MKTKQPLLLLFICSFFGLMGCGQKQKTMVSNEGQNKEVTEKIIKAFDEGNVNALDSFITKESIDHAEMPPGIKSKGLQAVKDMCIMQKKAFPNMKTTINSMVADGDTVMVYTTMEGTNAGSFMGMPATGKPIKVEGVDIIRFLDGKAVEHWGVYDNMKLMQQMGMMPQNKGMTSSDTAIKDTSMKK